jgi:hypothetical protein
MSDRCIALDLPTLVDYWLGELDATREADAELHVLGCGACADRLADVVRLGAAIRDVFVRGDVSAVLTPTFAQALAAAGWRMREYRVRVNGSVHCSVAPDDDFSLARLQAPLEDVEQLDLVRIAGGKVLERLTNVPFEPTAGEVVFAPAITALRMLHDETIHVELVDASHGTERVIAGYDFIHTAWKP